MKSFKINDKLVDWWSIPHFIIGYMFGRMGWLEPVEFTALNGGWELFEYQLKKRYDIFNIPFGKTTVYESKGNSVMDFIITEAGYGIGYSQLLAFRPMFEYLAKNTDHSLTGVEIGVWMGGNALNIVKKLPIEKLYLVDPYEEYTGENIQYPEDHPYLPPFIKQAKEIAHNRLKNHNNIEFIEKTSHEATKHVPGDLDFVYIDGNHSYDFVMDDIISWYPKVKTGGIIGGHDYTYPGVKNAVNDFAKTNNKIVYSGNADWWIIK